MELGSLVLSLLLHYATSLNTTLKVLHNKMGLPFGFRLNQWLSKSNDNLLILVASCKNAAVEQYSCFFGRQPPPKHIEMLAALGGTERVAAYAPRLLST